MVIVNDLSFVSCCSYRSH